MSAFNPRSATIQSLMASPISVTARDIKQGIVGECARCPIALAIRRRARQLGMRPTSNGIRVGSAAVNVVGTSRYSAFRLPTDATQFIRHFDLMVKVEPFTFTLQPYEMR